MSRNLYQQLPLSCYLLHLVTILHLKFKFTDCGYTSLNISTQWWDIWLFPSQRLKCPHHKNAMDAKSDGTCYFADDPLEPSVRFIIPAQKETTKNRSLDKPADLIVQIYIHRE